MADGENKIKKWIKKWQKDKGDIRSRREPPNHRAGGKPSRSSG